MVGNAIKYRLSPHPFLRSGSFNQELECPYLLPDVQVIRRRVNRESGVFGLFKVC